MNTLSKKQSARTIRNGTQGAAKELRRDTPTPWPIRVEEDMRQLFGRVASLEADSEMHHIRINGLKTQLREAKARRGRR